MEIVIVVTWSLMTPATSCFNGDPAHAIWYALVVVQRIIRRELHCTRHVHYGNVVQNTSCTVHRRTTTLARARSYRGTQSLWRQTGRPSGVFGDGERLDGPADKKRCMVHRTVYPTRAVAGRNHGYQLGDGLRMTIVPIFYYILSILYIYTQNIYI